MGFESGSVSVVKFDFFDWTFPVNFTKFRDIFSLEHLKVTVQSVNHFGKLRELPRASFTYIRLS